MDNETLFNFLIVADEGTLTAASKKLHIAQPALSKQLKHLESEFGVKLMERGARQLTLTEEGKILYEKIGLVKELYQATYQEISDCANGLSGTLRIALTFSDSSSMCNGLIPKFLNKYPHVVFEMYETETQEILGLLRAGVVELGIARGPFAQTYDLNTLYEHIEPFYAVYNPHGPYRSFESLEQVRLSNLDNVPICISRRFETIIKSAFAELGINKNIICTNTQLMSTLNWAKHGLCVGIVPKNLFLEHKDDMVNGKEICHSTLKTSRTLLSIKDRYLSAVSKQFCEMYISSQNDRPHSAALPDFQNLYGDV